MQREVAEASQMPKQKINKMNHLKINSTAQLIVKASRTFEMYFIYS